jgi:hypothetical protein
LAPGLILPAAKALRTEAAETAGQPEGGGGFHEGSAMHGVDSGGLKKNNKLRR